MKAIFRVGYTEYVLDTDKAISIIELLEGAEGAEIYESKYHAKTDTSESYSTYHIYKDSERDFSLNIITDEKYKMYKLAGKPE
jgi:hypothetical protein